MASKKFQTPEQLEILEDILTHVEDKNLSLREASKWLKYKTGINITYEGIRLMLKKRAVNEPANTGTAELFA